MRSSDGPVGIPRFGARDPHVKIEKPYRRLLKVDRTVVAEHLSLATGALTREQNRAKGDSNEASCDRVLCGGPGGGAVPCADSAVARAVGVNQLAGAAGQTRVGWLHREITLQLRHQPRNGRQRYTLVPPDFRDVLREGGHHEQQHADLL